MFRADENLTDFWRLCRADPLLRRCAEARAGALLRSATVFEDVVKTLCTTNCHWRNTKSMVGRLCTELGRRCGDSSDGGAQFTFPTPEVIVTANAAKLSSSGLGYRASYVQEFARTVLDGRVSFDEWIRIENPLDLRRKVMEIRGIGPYGANHIAMLLSRYDFVPCDSEVCAYLGFPPGTDPKKLERAIERRYRRWGKYAFLAFKFERMRQRNYRVDRGGSLDYLRAAAQAVGVSPASR